MGAVKKAGILMRLPFIRKVAATCLLGAGLISGGPLALAQLRVNPPAASPASTIIKLALPNDIARFLKDANATDVAVDGDRVTGKYKGIDIWADTFPTGDSAGEVSFYADFGIQESADQRFIDAFNKNRFPRIYRRENGKIQLWLGTNISAGVTVDYVKYLADSFLRNVDAAMTYKVD